MNKWEWKRFHQLSRELGWRYRPLDWLSRIQAELAQNSDTWVGEDPVKIYRRRRNLMLLVDKVTILKSILRAVQWPIVSEYQNVPVFLEEIKMRKLSQKQRQALKEWKNGPGEKQKKALQESIEKGVTWLWKNENPVRRFSRMAKLYNHYNSLLGGYYRN